MNNNEYYRLQIKKAMKLYPSIIAVTLSLLLVIGIACALLISQNSNSEDRQKLKIGVVGDMTDTYLDVGFAAIQNLDTSRHALDLVEMNIEEAVSSLKNGEIAAYLDIPDGFIQSVMEMKNMPITVVTASNPESIGDVLIDEIADSVSDLIRESQKGIHGMQKISKAYGKVENYWDNTEKLNIRYTEIILHRENVYETEYIGVSDGLSMGGYYVCGAITVFLLLWGISCSSMLIKKDRAMEKLMVSKGRSVFSQIISEFFVYFIVSFITVAIFVLFAGIVLQFVESGIKEVDGQYIGFFVGLLIKMIPVIFMINSLQFLFYEAMESTVSVILAQFVFALGTGYICGCFYPSHFFPVSLQKFAEKLPTGIGFEYIRRCLSDDANATLFFSVIIYTVLFLGVALTVRHYKLTGENQ